MGLLYLLAYLLYCVCLQYDGQCECIEGRGGRDCSGCRDNYWGDPNRSCIRQYFFQCDTSLRSRSSACVSCRLLLVLWGLRTHQLYCLQWSLSTIVSYWQTSIVPQHLWFPYFCLPFFMLPSLFFCTLFLFGCPLCGDSICFTTVFYFFRIDSVNTSERIFTRH